MHVASARKRSIQSENAGGNKAVKAFEIVKIWGDPFRRGAHVIQYVCKKGRYDLGKLKWEWRRCAMVVSEMSVDATRCGVPCHAELPPSRITLVA